MTDQDKKTIARGFALLWWKLTPGYKKPGVFEQAIEDFEFQMGVTPEPEDIS